MKIPDQVMEKLNTLEKNGFDAYIVGGASLYHYTHQSNIKGYSQIPKDYDIFTNATDIELLNLFNCKAMGGQDRLNKIFTIVTSDGIEISRYRSDGKRLESGNNIFDHQKTCDFTINAIAMKSDGTFILPPGVNHHLQKRELHAMGNPESRINEDYNRILRCIRIATKYNLYIENNLFQIIKDKPIDKIPGEVIRDELFKIIQYPDGIEKLHQSDLLFKIFPEMKPMKDLIGRGLYHQESVLDHSFMVTELLIYHFTNDPILIMSALLHDLGKVPAYDPETKKFTSHEIYGVSEALPILQRLKIKTHDIKKILWLIEHHMWAKESVTTRRRKWYKFFNSMKAAGVSIEEFLQLQYADTGGRMINDHWLIHTMKPYREWRVKQSAYKWYIEYKSNTYPQLIQDLKINGNDLITIGIEPSKQYTKILNRLWEMTLVSEVPNETDKLINLVTKWKENSQLPE